MNTIILWLMSKPGEWTMYVDVYRDAAECHVAEHILESIYPIYKFAHIQEVYEFGGGIGMFFIGCH